MADEVVFVLHRAVTVRPAAVTTKAVSYRSSMGDAMDSPTAFEVRHATDDEATENEQKLKEAVDRRVEELKIEAAVRRRVEQLRREGYQGKG